jgi:hypothetical protein
MQVSIAALQILTHMREKRRFLSAGNTALAAEVAALGGEAGAQRDALAKRKAARDTLRLQARRMRDASVYIDNPMLLDDLKAQLRAREALVSDIEDLQARLCARCSVLSLPIRCFCCMLASALVHSSACFAAAVGWRHLQDAVTRSAHACHAPRSRASARLTRRQRCAGEAQQRDGARRSDGAPDRGRHADHGAPEPLTCLVRTGAGCWKWACRFWERWSRLCWISGFGACLDRAQSGPPCLQKRTYRSCAGMPRQDATDMYVLVSCNSSCKSVCDMRRAKRTTLRFTCHATSPPTSCH